MPLTEDYISPVQFAMRLLHRVLQGQEHPGRRPAVIAAAPRPLAAHFAERARARLDLVLPIEHESATRPASVARMIAAPFTETRLERGGWTMALVAVPAGEPDPGAWARHAARAVKPGSPVATLVRLEDAARDPGGFLSDDPAEALVRPSGYAVPPLRLQRGGDPGPWMLLLWQRYDEQQDEQIVLGDYAQAAAEAVAEAIAEPSLLPAMGRSPLVPEPAGYPFGAVGGAAGRHMQMERLEPNTRAPGFLTPPPAAGTAARAASERGVLTAERVRASLEPAPRTLDSLEEPREAQSAQLAAVVPAALPATVGGHEIFVSFRAVRRLNRHAEAAGDGRLRVVDGESLDSVATVFDAETGEVTRYEDDELGALQRELAPQLLDRIGRTIRPAVTPDNAEEIWREFAERKPADLRDQPLGRAPWGRQHQAIAAGAVALRDHGKWLLAAEPGTGKTSMIATAAWLRGDRRFVVVCPPQVIAEWKIQLAEVFADVRCLTVHKPAQLAAVPDVPEDGGYVQCVFVPTSMLSWERRRGLGGTEPGRLPGSDGERERTARNSRVRRQAGPVPREPGHPFWVRFGDDDADPEAGEAAAEAIEAARVRAGEEPSAPAAVWHRYRALRDRVDENRRKATPIVRGVACPRCGETCTPHLDPDAYARRTGELVRCRAVLEDDSVCGEPLWQYSGHGRPRRPVRVCSACGWHRLDSSGRPLAARAAARGRCEACNADCSADGALEERLTDLRGGSIAAAWERIGFEADLLVLDEVHQFKGSGTQRGAEAGRLIGLAKAVALATGTLTNGQSSSLYHVLCRIAPALRKRFRSAAAFARSYGVSERSYDVVQRRPADRIAVRGLRSTERPGLHPLVLSELLGFSSFLGQPDILDREIEVEEFLEAVPMSDLPSPPISAQEHPEQWREWIDGPIAHALELVRAGGYGDAAAAEWERFVAASALPPGEREGAAGIRLFLQDSPAERYSALRDLILRPAARGEDGDGDGDGGDGGARRGRRTESMLGVMRMLPDTWHWRGEAVGTEFGRPRAVVPPSPHGAVSPKEERLIEICRGEVAAGRRCLVYVDGMDIRDVAGRLEGRLQEAGLNAVALRSRSSAAADRKSWIDARIAAGVEVVIAHPGAAGTGLNLQALPTVIAYEYTLSTVVMRQAMWRPLRVDQRDLVRMIFMCAKDTAQEAELVLYMSSLLASAPIEGRTITPDRLARRIGRTEISAQERGYGIMDVMLGRGGEEDGAIRRDLADALEHAAEECRWYPLPPLPGGGGRDAGGRPAPLAPSPEAGFEDVREDEPAAGGGFEARQLSLFAA